MAGVLREGVAMPKEVIHTGPDDDPRFTVQVGWTPDCDVQIATLNGAEPDSGWHVTLSRREVNRLIKALRRARDAAYGRDE